MYNEPSSSPSPETEEVVAAGAGVATAARADTELILEEMSQVGSLVTFVTEPSAPSLLLPLLSLPVFAVRAPKDRQLQPPLPPRLLRLRLLSGEAQDWRRREVSSRAGNEDSRRCHNHIEGPYFNLGPLN